MLRKNYVYHGTTYEGAVHAIYRVLYSRQQGFALVVMGVYESIDALNAKVKPIDTYKKRINFSTETINESSIYDLVFDDGGYERVS